MWLLSSIAEGRHAILCVLSLFTNHICFSLWSKTSIQRPPVAIQKLDVLVSFWHDKFLSGTGLCNKDSFSGFFQHFPNWIELNILVQTATKRSKVKCIQLYAHFSPNTHICLLFKTLLHEHAQAPALVLESPEWRFSTDKSVWDKLN